jgi:hypothetical protein
MLPRRARAKERLRSLLEVQWLAIEPDDRVLLYVDRTRFKRVHEAACAAV